MHEVLPDQSHFFSRHGAPPGTVGFYGTWHVRTRGYSGDAEMVLWMPPGPPVVVGHAVRPGEFERFAAAVPIASGQPVPAGVAAVAGRAGMPTVEAVGVPVPVERSSKPGGARSNGWSLRNRCPTPPPPLRSVRSHRGGEPTASDLYHSPASNES